jgi:hypothetical protein
MKRALLGLVVLLLAALAAVYLSIDQIASHAIVRGASQALGVKTRVGFVRLSPFAGKVKVSALSIDNPPGFAGDHFLAFDSFELETDLRSLRSPVVRVPLFQLEGIDVSLERQGDTSNTDAIFENLKRFEKQGSATQEQPAPKGPERRFVVSKLAIRDITAHVEWNALVSKQSALDVHLDGIELNNPGGSRGLTLPELSNLVVKAVLESVRKSGQLPRQVASDLAGGLTDLARVPLAITGGVLGKVGEVLPGAAGEAVGEIGGAVEGAGDAALEKLDGLFGRKKEKQR